MGVFIRCLFYFYVHSSPVGLFNEGFGRKSCIEEHLGKETRSFNRFSVSLEYSLYSTVHHPSTAVFYVDVVITLNNVSSHILRLLLGNIDLENERINFRSTCNRSKSWSGTKHTHSWLTIQDDQVCFSGVQPHVNFINETH